MASEHGSSGFDGAAVGFKPQEIGKPVSHGQIFSAGKTGEDRAFGEIRRTVRWSRLEPKAADPVGAETIHHLKPTPPLSP